MQASRVKRPCQELQHALNVGSQCVPICSRHNVTQLSRVTGYIGDVKGWNAGKQQELKDRKRYDMLSR
jgi:anaerobic ribonucleoside-triphosphate reductase